MNRSIGNGLRSYAKARGLSQTELAKMADVSLPTMKRWLAGNGLSLENLGLLLKILGVSLEELAAQISTEQSREVELTREQEECLAKDLSLLAYLDLLLKGAKPQKIAREFHLSDRRSASLLRTLEKQGLLERHEGGAIKLLIRGQLRWRLDGPLAKTLKRKILDDFLSDARIYQVRLGVHQINADDYKRLEGMLIEVQNFARMAESRATVVPDHPRSTGLLIGLAPFTWKTLETII